MFHQVITANGSRACAWVLYLKYTGQRSWDLQYCFMHLHSCYRPCKAKMWLFSHLQKDAEAEHLHWLLCTAIPSKVQGASHTPPRGSVLLPILIHPKAQAPCSPSCLLHCERNSNAEEKRSCNVSKPINQVGLTLGWNQNFSHP